VSRNDRSPLHSSALRLCDITPGKEYVVYNLKLGSVMDAGWFLSGPYMLVDRDDQGNSVFSCLAVNTRSILWGVDAWPLADIGVVQHQGTWSPCNFTVAASRAYLLPPPRHAAHLTLHTWGTRQFAA